MTLPSEEFLCGSGAAAPAERPSARWLRPALQWLAVGAAHAAVLGAVLHLSPQARQVLGEIVQASLIMPPAPPEVRPPEPPKPPKPPPPRRQPPKPAPVLAATPQAETPAPAYFVPAAPADPAPADPAPAPVAAPPPPLIPPVFNADYLENPLPQYPPMSRRLGEKGRVLLRVFVSVDGRAERIEVKTSSGFERLDHAAREAVAGWRFVPARRGDEKVAAWVQIPIAFVM